MFIEDLDRHQWSFREARLHVARLILRQIELAGTPPSDGQGVAPQWYRSGEPRQRDGDADPTAVIAAGRVAPHRVRGLQIPFGVCPSATGPGRVAFICTPRNSRTARPSS